jgi:hypothetical protein
MKQFITGGRRAGRNPVSDPIVDDDYKIGLGALGFTAEEAKAMDLAKRRELLRQKNIADLTLEELEIMSPVGPGYGAAFTVRGITAHQNGKASSKIITMEDLERQKEEYKAKAAREAEEAKKPKGT